MIHSKRISTKRVKRTAQFDRILVAVDDSVQSEWAVETAARLAKSLGAKVGLVHAFRVVPSPQETAIPYSSLEAERQEVGREVLQRHAQRIKKALLGETLCLEGEAADAILAAAYGWNAKLIVMGTHGRGRLAQFLVGSTTDAVIRRATCPVMAVAQEPVPIAVAEHAEAAASNN